MDHFFFKYKEDNNNYVQYNKVINSFGGWLVGWLQNHHSSFFTTEKFWIIFSHTFNKLLRTGIQIQTNILRERERAKKKMKYGRNKKKWENFI